MFARKLVICLAIAAIVVITSEVGSTLDLNPYASKNSIHSNDLIIGNREPGDRLVLRQPIECNASSWMQIVTTQKIFHAPKWERITQVKVLDQKTNGTGAAASLLQGGPGHNNATIRFKSRRGHGINFFVELYSRP